MQAITINNYIRKNLVSNLFSNLLLPLWLIVCCRQLMCKLPFSSSNLFKLVHVLEMMICFCACYITYIVLPLCTVSELGKVWLGDMPLVKGKAHLAPRLKRATVPSSIFSSALPWTGLQSVVVSIHCEEWGHWGSYLKFTIPWWQSCLCLLLCIRLEGMHLFAEKVCLCQACAGRFATC